MKFIDISVDVLNTPVYPGDPFPEVQWLDTIEGGYECNLSKLDLCVHTGTHMDAPLHFIDNGDSIDLIDPDAFIGPCKVIEVKEGPITGEYVNKRFPKNCERLLIKGGGRAWFMDSSAVEAAALGFKLIGTDALSVGCSGQQLKPHKAFLGNGIAVLEGLNLAEVAPGDYFLVAPPIKLGGLEAAPVRAFLVSDYIFWSK